MATALPRVVGELTALGSEMASPVSPVSPESPDQALEAAVAAAVASPVSPELVALVRAAASPLGRWWPSGTR